MNKSVSRCVEDEKHDTYRVCHVSPKHLDDKHTRPIHENIYREERFCSCEEEGSAVKN